MASRLHPLSNDDIRSGGCRNLRFFQRRHDSEPDDAAFFDPRREFRGIESHHRRYGKRGGLKKRLALG